MTNTRPYQITAELLSALQTEGYALGVDKHLQEGYALGVDKHLQIQTLLNKLPDDLTDEALKCALIPLLAQSPAEQEQLYGVFDDCVKRVNEIPVEPEPIAPPVIKPPKRYELWQILTALGLLILLSIGGYFLYQKLNPEPQKPIVEAPTNVNPNENITETTPQPKPSTEASPFVDNKPYPFPKHLDDYDEVSPTQQWLSENWAWLRWLLALVWTTLLVALWRYRAWKRQKLIAQQDPNEKPPYFWNIHIEGADDFLVADNVDYAAQLMRRRADADAFRLDLPRTIQATVERGGMAAFRFKKQTTPSEYLLLIDRQSVRNHRARLFDKLYEAFKAQEVEIARYFYDSDLRTCYDEAHPYGISLADVQQRHYQARLIVVGTGAQLLNPLSNKPAAWTAVFEQWKNRALLTPKPLKSWGYDERQLSTLLTTLPATLQGLGFWVEELELGDDARFETWTEKVHDAPNAPIQPDAADPMPMLQLYFDLPMLEWIAACAIYPTLHWDLTLWLGNALQSDGVTSSHPVTTPVTPLSNYHNLTQLNRLSWFVAGEMPNETRAALLNWLEVYKPVLLQKLRLALALELQKNPPPADSVAYEPFRMTVAVNEWLATDDAERKKELETEIAQLLAKGAEPDFTVIKYLKKPRTALDFVVPDAWKKYVFPSGFPALGWLKEWKDFWWLLPTLVVGLVALFYPRSFNSSNCAADNIVSLTVRDTVHYFCLEDPLSNVAYQEQLVHGYIEKRQTDSMTSSHKGKYLFKGIVYNDDNALSLSQQRLINECNQNIAVDYYRLAHVYYKEGRKDSACLMLDKAVEYDSLDTDIQRARRDYCNKIISADIVFEQDYEPFDVKGVYGYRHAKTKKTLIPPQYQDAHIFLEGVAAVKVNGQWGFIDTSTRTLIPPQYDYAYGFNEGMCLIRSYKNDYKHGYIDRTGRIVIPPQYAVASKFENGIATVKINKTDKNNLCIDKTGKQVDCKTGALLNTTTPIATTTAGGAGTSPISTTGNRDSAATSILAPKTVFVKGGRFTMGCTNEQGKDCEDDEKPAHQVTVSDFAIGKYEVTVEQFASFIKDSDYKTDADKEGTSYVWTGTKYEEQKGVNWKCDVSGKIRPQEEYKHPVIHVSWNDATAYCQWLNSKTNKNYKLPTEAQWEYAARGGNKSKGFKYSGSDNIKDIAWYDDNSENKTHIVGTRGANELGIHDMSGNVWEWCSDYYDENYYKNSPSTNPQGAAKSEYRSLRGGSWVSIVSNCRVSLRSRSIPYFRSSDYGFRVALVSQDK